MCTPIGSVRKDLRILPVSSARERRRRVGCDGEVLGLGDGPILGVSLYLSARRKPPADQATDDLASVRTPKGCESGLARQPLPLEPRHGTSIEHSINAAISRNERSWSIRKKLGAKPPATRLVQLAELPRTGKRRHNSHQSLLSVHLSRRAKPRRSGTKDHQLRQRR